MKDMRNKEVQVGDLVVFNHPKFRTLDMSEVLDVTPDGVMVTYTTISDLTYVTIIPEKQFVIIGADKENVYGT